MGQTPSQPSEEEAREKLRTSGLAAREDAIRQRAKGDEERRVYLTHLKESGNNPKSPHYQLATRAKIASDRAYARARDFEATAQRAEEILSAALADKCDAEFVASLKVLTEAQARNGRSREETSTVLRNAEQMAADFVARGDDVRSARLTPIVDETEQDAEMAADFAKLMATDTQQTPSRPSLSATASAHALDALVRNPDAYKWTPPQ